MLDPCCVVWLIHPPLPVVPPSSGVETFTHQRPFPAVDVVVQTDPEGLVPVHVLDSGDFVFIRYSGQVAVLGSAEALGFSPAHLHVSDEDVLMDVVCKAYRES